ncbi:MULTISPECIES: DUF2759 domain-containing protein [Peribacillus]|uniref:DUF2759 domain-containing protein n=1 Tax=Peribacillus asahii TaxID=228899 RepID=A0A398BIS4_9BACI|nr:DUF2759 domain-containing protein [Peribacillus asahii]AZV44378.1 membrane protein hypothetical protein [Peribacillus asahii]RID89417.1 DUF2759 domain-containing protein [Peribacillus asahii]USK58797.1 DUF2759 domain-containing protein [Peribacillus asahii]USK69206.1 DUF2759 domain-containing protein [Peribacillus asahii]USK84078.1 DUF2759 domain-containing protein [Peribacillus asahii]
MVLMIIFGLVSILALFAVFTTLKNKNYLGLLFAGGSAAVFGWFTVMTILNSGFPVAH